MDRFLFGYVVIATFALLICFVLIRSRQMKKLGMVAFHFGAMDKKDFIIPPFVLLYLYLIVANTFNLPRFGSVMSDSIVAAFVGVALCVLALVLFLWGIISFGKSFRVGIDEDKPGGLVSTGAFAISRNPLYLAFFMVLLGVFLIFPTWVFLVYFLAALWLIDRQVCLEENSLRKTYGKAYDDYCAKVRRYI